MKKTTSALFILTALTFSGCSKKPPRVPAKQGLQQLMEGNARYVSNKSEHPNRNAERRAALASKQMPYAIIVGCSDSRVAPEIIFDTGLGELFVVRVAGNVVGSIELESIEYSALHLNSSIILVLGHENCGAVHAVVEDQTDGIEMIAKLIEPAVKQAEAAKTDSLLEQAVKNNALNMKDFIEKSPNFKKLIQDKMVEVQAAYYNLKTGKVELLNTSTKTIQKLDES